MTKFILAYFAYFVSCSWKWKLFNVTKGVGSSQTTQIVNNINITCKFIFIIFSIIYKTFSIKILTFSAPINDTWIHVLVDSEMCQCQPQKRIRAIYCLCARINLFTWVGITYDYTIQPLLLTCEHTNFEMNTSSSFKVMSSY